MGRTHGQNERREIRPYLSDLRQRNENVAKNGAVKKEDKWRERVNDRGMEK